MECNKITLLHIESVLNPVSIIIVIFPIIGSDKEKADGTYSAYFHNFDSTGEYELVIDVVGFDHHLVSSCAQQGKLAMMLIVGKREIFTSEVIDCSSNFTFGGKFDTNELYPFPLFNSKRD